MLSVSDFKTGSVDDIAALSLFLPVQTGEETLLVFPIKEHRWCVVLDGQYRFSAFVSDIYAAPRRGLIIPDVHIEVDEKSAFDPGAKDLRGALVRSGSSIGIRVLVEGAGYRQARLLELMSDLPAGSKDISVGFSKWAITHGTGEHRRELFVFDPAAGDAKAE